MFLTRLTVEPRIFSSPRMTITLHFHLMLFTIQDGNRSWTMDRCLGRGLYPRLCN